MNFLANILPTDISDWTVKNGSITTQKILLQPSGSAMCYITDSNIAYIPEAFQVRVRHNADVDWKHPDVYVTLQINYEDGSELHTLVPLNIDSVTAAGNMTINVAYVESKTFNDMQFIIYNNSSQDVTINLYELRPSQAMADSLYNAIDSLLPQLVYAYNTGEVVTNAGSESQILQLPVSVGEATNLLVHITVSGTTIGDTLICTLKFDGEVVQTFPVKQVASSGDFYFGIPSLIPFVAIGPHLATLHISAEASSVTVPANKALLTIDGKGILGGASGEYPHAEVVQEIFIADMLNGFAQDISVREISVDIYNTSTFIPIDIPDISTSYAFEIIRRGDVIELSVLGSGHASITPYDPSVYITDMLGLSSITTAKYSYTKEVLENCTIIKTTVDTTRFNPVYSGIIEEVMD